MSDAECFNMNLHLSILSFQVEQEADAALVTRAEEKCIKEQEQKKKKSASKSKKPSEEDLFSVASTSGASAPPKTTKTSKTPAKHAPVKGKTSASSVTKSSTAARSSGGSSETGAHDKAFREDSPAPSRPTTSVGPSKAAELIDASQMEAVFTKALKGTFQKELVSTMTGKPLYRFYTVFCFFWGWLPDEFSSSFNGLLRLF
jgi:hypothetical protein